MTHASVNLHAYRHRTRPGRSIQAAFFANWASHGTALMNRIRSYGFEAYGEDGKLVVRLDPLGREEVVIRPGHWLVLDVKHPRRTCRAQSWVSFEFTRSYALDLEELAA